MKWYTGGSYIHWLVKTGIFVIKWFDLGATQATNPPPKVPSLQGRLADSDSGMKTLFELWRCCTHVALTVVARPWTDPMSVFVALASEYAMFYNNKHNANEQLNGAKTT